MFKKKEIYTKFLKVLSVLKNVLRFLGFFRYTRKEKIYRYIKNNDIESLKNVLNKKIHGDLVDKKGRTPLMYAIYKKNCEAFFVLLGNSNIRKDINREDEDGNTVLGYALVNLRGEKLSSVVSSLLKNGASVNSKNKYGKRIFDYVYDDEILVKKLLQSEKELTENHWEETKELTNNFLDMDNENNLDYREKGFYSI